MANKESIIPVEQIESHILQLRGQNVILDRDIAELYGVKPIALRQQVKRNLDRFPEDFILRLTKEEADFLVSQNVIPSKRSLGGYLPYAFTEQGVAMLSSVLNSKRAIHVNIAIMRAFVKFRETISKHKELANKLSQLENKIKKHDTEIHAIFEAIRQLMLPVEKPGKRIGF